MLKGKQIMTRSKIINNKNFQIKNQMVDSLKKHHSFDSVIRKKSLSPKIQLPQIKKNLFFNHSQLFKLHDSQGFIKSSKVIDRF